MLKRTLINEFNFTPNKNQLREIERLIFEIIKRDSLNLEEIITFIKNNSSLDKIGGGNKFFAIKNILIKKRFPLTNQKLKIDTKKVFLNSLTLPLKDNCQIKQPFKPEIIYIEKAVRNSELSKKFTKKFPNIETRELNSCGDYLKNYKFSIGQLKRPLVFIVKEKSDFIKPCPCTKSHISCGYWIFNLGFGCPYDCSYCFLQQYTNFPGIILPANLEDFFDKFGPFAEKLSKPIRIGTGEFCDSLAMDDITEYSLKLIPYFKNKNVIFELKTKSDNIENLLKIEPPPNIVISWSLTPALIAEKEEIGPASIIKRLAAAKKIQGKGYKIAFHFDPIIYAAGWENLYKELITTLYSSLKPPLAWISLGTLRSHRKLKPITEARFPQSDIFYGELFLGEDKKLRYPDFLRKEIYKTMVKNIRDYDSQTPIYLCMETLKLWQEIFKTRDFSSIEKNLLFPY